MEIERKFLINNINQIDLNKYEHKKITQDYLYNDICTTIRKRKIEKNNSIKYFYTIKTNRTNISVNEIEYEINKETYENLKADSNRNTIIKTRYIIPYIDNLKIELDIFEGNFKGIIFAEIEFESETQAYNTPLPNWFNKDISKIISNSKMSKLSKEECLKILNNN